MNAIKHANSPALLQTLSSSLSIVRFYYPEARPCLSPWRDDPQTQLWNEIDTIDMSFAFPGWRPSLQCRSLLMQLRVKNHLNDQTPNLLGVLLRGMTFDGERWRIATIGKWAPTGPHLPTTTQIAKLKQICRELFTLYEGRKTFEVPE